MADDWSAEEVAATVADYFDMLARELRGEPYSKRDHNRRLQQLLRGRSAGAIEFKHQNISAILIEEGFPPIDGYKPRVNYQDRLRHEVVARLLADAPLAAAAAAAVAADVREVPLDRPLDDIVVPVPTAGPRGNRLLERAGLAPVPRLGVNYLEREAKNVSLGRAGELFVLDCEHRRLWEAGARHLAERIEHVASTQGDGLGFDISSFDPDGSERLIEVKTTGFGPLTPFFASKREVTVSDERADSFRLYRVFRFRTEPQMFVIPGPIRHGCLLEPVQFRATLA
jgi:hypothetical protein